jgi:hypothetical protein
MAYKILRIFSKAALWRIAIAFTIDKATTKYIFSNTHAMIGHTHSHQLVAYRIRSSLWTCLYHVMLTENVVKVAPGLGLSRRLNFERMSKCTNMVAAATSRYM